MAERRRWLAASALLLAALPAACGKPEPELNVVLEGRANAEHASQACVRARTWQQQNRDAIARDGCAAVSLCPEMTPLLARCAADPIGDLRAFEDALLAQAAADARCKGVRMVRVADRDAPDPTALALLQKPHWRLHVDYQPGASQQRWWMTDSPSRATYPKGDGEATEIAAEVCAIAVARGARMLN
jgi:hypothetical protein